MENIDLDRDPVNDTDADKEEQMQLLPPTDDRPGNMLNSRSGSMVNPLSVYMVS